MKKLLSLFSLVSVLFLVGCERVPAGHVGVIVHSLGTSSGVDNEVVGVGRKWLGINDELFLFPTFSQNYVWDKAGDKDESLTFGTSEGLSISADMGITYNIQPDKVAVVFQKYRKGVDEITQIYLRNMVRDALVTSCSTRGVETIYGAGKADLIKEVEEAVREQVRDIGIVVERVYWIGDLRLPAQVTASINAKIQATQISMQRENEVKTAQAQAAIEVAQAQGQADSKLALAESEAKAIRLKGDAQAYTITAKARALATNPNLIDLTKAERWNGILPTTMIPNSTLPFLDVK